MFIQYHLVIMCDCQYNDILYEYISFIMFLLFTSIKTLGNFWYVYIIVSRYFHTNYTSIKI